MKKQLRRYVITAGLATALSACASKVPRPTSELALAQTALESAEFAGAQQLAPIELRLARDKQAAAESALEKGKYFKARYLAIEARVDAEYAHAAANNEKSRRELAREQDNIEVLPVSSRSIPNTE